MQRQRILTVSVFCGLVCAAPGVFAQSEECQKVQFSERVLERFPNIAQACLDVIEKDGEKYAVIKADLQSSTRDGVRVRIKKPDGTYTETRFIKVDRDRRILVDNEKVRVEDLSPGQELTTYVKVTEPMIALAPETETAPLELAPLEQPASRVAAAPAPELPETASPLPAIGASGLALMTLGLLLAVSRGWRPWVRR